jgi:hypothetical protein
MYVTISVLRKPPVNTQKKNTIKLERSAGYLTIVTLGLLAEAGEERLAGERGGGVSSVLIWGTQKV